MTGGPWGYRARTSTRADWEQELTGPTWARRLWGSRAGRIGLSLAFLGASVWILASGINDPDAFFDRGRNVVGFACAPVLVVTFSFVLGETIRDLVSGDNRRPLLTQPRVHRPMGIFLAIYVPVAVVAIILWH